jgi:renal tumor antigen
VHKIHNILGTPDTKVLERFQKQATHMEFNFPPKKGTGIEQLIPHISKDAIDLIYKLLIYDPEKRITADEALAHPYFRDLFELEHSVFNNTLSSMKLSP